SRPLVKSNVAASVTFISSFVKSRKMGGKIGRKCLFLLAFFSVWVKTRAKTWHDFWRGLLVNYFALIFSLDTEIFLWWGLTRGKKYA
ncbi:MAG: hypothetical protein JSW00_09010, partial [Thermoplasmata archaeon]